MRRDRMTISLVRAIPMIFWSRAEPPLWQCIEARFRDNAEIAGERELEPHSEAVTSIGGDHRLCAARGCGNVPGEIGNVFGGGFQEAFDIAAAGEMLADRPQHDDADACIIVQNLE